MVLVFEFELDLLGLSLFLRFVLRPANPRMIKSSWHSLQLLFLTKGLELLRCIVLAWLVVQTGWCVLQCVGEQGTFRAAQAVHLAGSFAIGARWVEVCIVDTDKFCPWRGLLKLCVLGLPRSWLWAPSGCPDIAGSGGTVGVADC